MEQEQQILAVQRMQDHIEQHLYENVTLADLARAASYSPFYAHRLFVRWLDLAPADYIRRLRLAKSALQLRDEGGRITDLAFEVGFGSVDGYQRAFYKEFGCNPNQYAKNPVPIWLFTPYGVKYREMRKENIMEKVKTIFIQRVQKPARKALIKRGKTAADYWAYCEEVGCDVWGLLTSMKSLAGEPVCLWLPAALILPGTSQYVQGVELAADYAGPVPEGFDLIDLPAAEYLQFQGEPFEEEDYCAAIEQVWEAMEKYDPAAAGLCWDEASPRIQLEPIGSRGYIELKAAKPL